jgi:hypothetical protein
MSGGGLGLLGATVCPTYVALSDHPSDPAPPDLRGQIRWADDVGQAAPMTRRGEYKFVQYFYGPTGPVAMAGELDQVYRHDTDGPKVIAPITSVDGLITAHVAG